MFPPVPNIPKESAFDTTLRTKNKKGETVMIPCPKGTQVNMSVIALHFNRKLMQHWCNSVLRTDLQRSTGPILRSSIPIASLENGIGTHSFLSRQERDHALVEGMPYSLSRQERVR